MDDSYIDVTRNEAIMEGNRFLIEGLRERVSTHRDTHRGGYYRVLTGVGTHRILTGVGTLMETAS